MHRCLEAAGLEQTLHALQRYFFMGAGDWADALIAGLCRASLAVEPFLLHELQSTLDAAIQACPPCQWHRSCMEEVLILCQA